MHSKYFFKCPNIKNLINQEPTIDDVRYRRVDKMIGVFDITGKSFRNRKKLFLILPGVLVFFFTMHGVNIAKQYNFIKFTKANGISTQDPKIEYQNTRAHAAPFWKIVDSSINSK